MLLKLEVTNLNNYPWWNCAGCAIPGATFARSQSQGSLPTAPVVAVLSNCTRGAVYLEDPIRVLPSKSPVVGCLLFHLSSRVDWEHRSRSSSLREA